MTAAGGYLATLELIERLHRRLIDAVEDEFRRVGRAHTLTGVQALVLFRLGDRELTPGELRKLGVHLGRNVSPVVSKLTRAGYLDHRRSTVDRRLAYVSLSPKGQEARRTVQGLFARQVAAVAKVADLGPAEIAQMDAALVRLERFLADWVNYQL